MFKEKNLTARNFFSAIKTTTTITTKLTMLRQYLKEPEYFEVRMDHFNKFTAPQTGWHRTGRSADVLVVPTQTEGDQEEYIYVG